jgi:hypothetical protein
MRACRERETTMSKLSRRSLLGSAAIVGIAGLSPIEVLAAMPGEIPAGTSREALSDLAKVRGLVARLVAIDDEITAAEEADDAKRVDLFESEHGRVYRQFRDLQNEIENTPPRCWLDVITRAEFAGYEYLHGKAPADWESQLATLHNEFCEFSRAKAGLALAVLWLDRKGGANA